MSSQVFRHNVGPMFAHNRVATARGAEGNPSQAPVVEVSTHGGSVGSGGSVVVVVVVVINGGITRGGGTITAGGKNGTIGNFMTGENEGLLRFLMEYGKIAFLSGSIGPADWTHCNREDSDCLFDR